MHTKRKLNEIILWFLPKECAAVVLELKNRPSPRSPSFTTPVAVMNTLAGFISVNKRRDQVKDKMLGTLNG
jgi:hypothetical protein